jgi:DNA-binding GntR family transcriptional regulator
VLHAVALSAVDNGCNGTLYTWRRSGIGRAISGRGAGAGRSGRTLKTRAISRSSVREQVRDILHAQIQTGELQAGVLYSAVALAEGLGVSATPVREALMDLENAGLVEAVRNRGFRVRTVSAADLDEIVAVRTWLEVPAMSLVLENATDAEIEALRPLADRICEEARRKDSTQFLVADTAFHTALLELTGSPRLVKLVSELRGQTHLLGLRGLGASGALEASGDEHVTLVNALATRDETLARDLMRHHLQHARGIWAGLDEQA